MVFVEIYLINRSASYRKRSLNNLIEFATYRHDAPVMFGVAMAIDDEGECFVAGQPRLIAAFGNIDGAYKGHACDPRPLRGLRPASSSCCDELS